METTETTETTTETLTAGEVIPSSLSISRVGYGEGLTEKEALLNWLRTDPQLQKDGISFGESAIDLTLPVTVNQVRGPVPPKRASKVKAPKNKQVWETTFSIKDSQMQVIKTCSSKAEAMKEAKSLAMSMNQTVSVHKEKRLVSGDTLEASFSPGKSKLGRFKFKATFKY